MIRTSFVSLPSSLCCIFRCPFLLIYALDLWKEPSQDLSSHKGLKISLELGENILDYNPTNFLSKTLIELGNGVTCNERMFNAFLFIYFYSWQNKSQSINKVTTRTTTGMTASVQNKGHGTHAMEPDSLQGKCP